MEGCSINSPEPYESVIPLFHCTKTRKNQGKEKKRSGKTLFFVWKLYTSPELWPQTLTSVRLFSNALNGTVNSLQFPRYLEEIYLSRNQFYGNFNLQGLPSNLIILDLSFNHFNILMNFTGLPRNIEQLIFTENTFHGVLRLSILFFKLFFECPKKTINGAKLPQIA